MNSGYGSNAAAYGCRAWVNFNGTGTVAIRSSGNITSITDNNTGDYTVNFATAMPDASYATVGSAIRNASDNNLALSFPAASTYSVSAVRVRTALFTGPSTYEDSPTVLVVIFR
jgi:hypothetical protein